MAKVSASAVAGKTAEDGFTSEEIALGKQLFKAVSAGVRAHAITQTRHRWSEQERPARVMFYLAAREARRLLAVKP